MSDITFIILFQTLLALEGIFNAVMDTCAHHYNNSIFRRWAWFRRGYDLDWHWPWDAPITQVKDAWHFFKMLHYAALMAATGVVAFYSINNMPTFWWVFSNIVAGYVVLRNAVFLAFYKKIFYRAA
jgi:hypothetical protein